MQLDAASVEHSELGSAPHADSSDSQILLAFKQKAAQYLVLCQDMLVVTYLMTWT